MLTFIFEPTNVISRYYPNDDSNVLHDGSYLMQRAKLFAYVNNNIDIKRILQDKQFHLQLKSKQKQITQNVLERKDSMAVLITGFGKRLCYVPNFWTR
jgi:superfamily II DNA or RNA helicase